MKLAIGILLVIIATLVLWLTVEITTNGQQRKHIQELTSQVADKSRRENLEFQQMCALQVEKVFRAIGWKEGVPQDGNIATYQSHYNPKLGKCFMTLDITGMNTTRTLFDAYEQRDYAVYLWMPRKDKKFWEVPPTICRLIPSSGSEQICKSEEEYKEFVAHYME